MDISETVTVLIPTFNRAKLLSRAVKSVLQQSYTKFQIIICDNASTDDTDSVVHDLMISDKRILSYRHESNIGGLNNFRFAISLVSTPYFSILSDDDLLTRNFLMNGVKVLKQYENIGFVMQNTLFVDNFGALISTGGHVLDPNVKLYCSEGRFDSFHEYKVPYIWTAMLFRGELSHLYKKEMEGDISHDTRFLFRVISRYNYAHISTVGAFFTSHHHSMSSARPYFDMLQYTYDCYRYLEILQDNMVDESVKARVRFHLGKLIAINPYRIALKEAFRHLLKNCCNSPELPAHSILQFAKEFEGNGFIWTSIFFSNVYRSRILRSIIRILYQPINNYRITKTRRKMIKLQNTVYKAYFDDMKLLTES